MTLKTDFFNFVQDELHIPLVGIAPADDYPQEDVERIAFVVKTFARSTPLAEGNDTVLQAKDFLPEAQSVIVLGTPAYMGEIDGFEECRKELLGRAEPSHVNVNFLQVSSEKSYRIADFFTSRGFQCFPLIGGQFPLKLMASKCGVGYYGKNAIIQHPDYGSWISLSAYVTDAELEPDNPLEGDCGTCELCLSVCPTGAIFAPYRCDVTRCVDFQLGHNKKDIPVEIRGKSGNLMGEGCTTCRDICPKNRKLKPVEGFDTPRELLHPSLVKVLDITDDEWESSFATTLMGFFLMDKMYLKRNAAIGLGNFKDERALDALSRFLDTGEDEVRGYAAWAVGNIGGGKAEKILKSSLAKEENGKVKEEIEAALMTVQ